MLKVNRVSGNAVRIRCGVAAFLVMTAATSALAQQPPRLQLSASYTTMRDKVPDAISVGWTSRTLDFEGWRVTGGFNLTRNVSIVGETSVYYRPLRAQFFGNNVRLRNQSFLGGPRITWRAVPRVALFGEALLGAVHATYGIVDQPAAYGSRTALALQPGGGVELWVAPHLAVRGALGYRRIFFSPRRASEPLVDGGFAVGF